VTYLVGQAISLAVIVTQNDPVTGLPVLDGSGNRIRVDDASMAITVWKPDLTTVTPTPTIAHPSLGVYTVQFTPDVLGWWQYSFQGTTTAPGRGRSRIYVSPVP
jgi:hypothetical protein